MGMARLLGGSTPRFLVQVFSIKPYRAEAFAIIRCASRGVQHKKVGTGSGPQTNSAGTMRVKDEPVPPNLKDKSSRKGNGQVNDKTTERSA